MILRKIPDKRCPSCLQVQLEAIELEEGQVSAYVCNSCGAYYDAVISRDFDRNELWWIGKLRNPDFWDIETNTIVESLMDIEMKTGRGIEEYLGQYPIERIDV